MSETLSLASLFFPLPQGPWKQPGAKHSKAGCAGCGTLASLGGCGGCVEKPKNTPCECEYHRFEGARAVDKAIRKAATSLPKTLEAARTYESQRRAAAGACRAAAAQYGVAAGERLAWMQRPSVDDLFVRSIPSPFPPLILPEAHSGSKVSPHLTSPLPSRRAPLRRRPQTGRDGAPHVRPPHVGARGRAAEAAPAAPLLGPAAPAGRRGAIQARACGGNFSVFAAEWVRYRMRSRARKISPECLTTCPAASVKTHHTRRAISIKSASCRGAGKRSEEDEDGGGAGGSDGVYYVLEWAARAGLPGCPTAEEAEDLSWLAKQPAQHRSALRWIVDESAPQLAADLQAR